MTTLEQDCVIASEAGYAEVMGAELLAEMNAAEIAELGAERALWLDDERNTLENIQR